VTTGKVLSTEKGVPVFKLTLEKTYYQQGFFNVSVDFDRFVRPTDGPVELALGAHGRTIEGKVNRRANRNGTARISGGSKLRDWLQANYSQGDVVEVDLSSLTSIRIGDAPPVKSGVRVEGGQPTPSDRAASVATRKAVGADDLARWRRELVRLLDVLDDSKEDEEGVGARINRLSRSGRIPREIAAFMKVVTEVRNAAEYQAKKLSQVESAAVRNARAAVIEWAASMRIVPDGW
jgi:hypothetical protein